MKLICFRILRWVREEEERVKANKEITLRCLILDMTGTFALALPKLDGREEIDTLYWTLLWDPHV